MVAEKRRVFEEWLGEAIEEISKSRPGDGESDWVMILRVTIKKMFWKEVKLVRKGEQARDELVKDVNGQILIEYR